ncbi:MAG: hypothetical protein AAGG48_15665 [Planctomycetota bacterium]
MPGLEDIAKRLRGYQLELSELEKQLEPYKPMSKIPSVGAAMKKLSSTQLEFDLLKEKFVGVSTVNDGIMAKEFQEQANDIHDVTSGKIDVEDLQTKGNDDAMQIANDAEIASEYQKQGNDIDDITSGKANVEDIVTKGKQAKD